MPIRVVPADDSFIIREGMRELLQSVDELALMATCGDLDSLLAAIEREHPDVVLTDIRMPPTNTDEAAPRRTFRKGAAARAVRRARSRTRQVAVEPAPGRHQVGDRRAEVAGAWNLPAPALEREAEHRNECRLPAGPASGESRGRRVGRYAPEIEAAVYFYCLEALQNAAKYAGTEASARVRIWGNEGGLLFEVSDNGHGFATHQNSEGAGLTNMRDRLGAVGGTLRVESDGHGTRIHGVVPVSATTSDRPEAVPAELPS